MGGLKIKKRVPWERVTNVLVMQHALKDCVDCKGGGELTNTAGVRFVCHCADAPFKKAYEGRLRRTKEGRLEYREMAAVPSAEFVAAFNSAMAQVMDKVSADVPPPPKEPEPA